MKKVLLSLTLIAALSLTSCNKVNKTEETTEVCCDSTTVDTTSIDSTSIDTTLVDTIQVK